MADIHHGVVSDSATYSTHALAKMLDVEEETLRKNLFKEGVPYRKFGSRYLVAGLSVRLWVESGDGPHHAGGDA